MTLPHRVAGNLALDLANTISWRGTDREIDHLATVDGILAWARVVGLVDAGFQVVQTELDILADDVRTLRAAIGEAGQAIARGGDAPASAVTIIRTYAARALHSADFSGTPVQMSFHGTERIVGAIAWSALDLLRGHELNRLKQCPPSHCQWLFIDRTKNGSRRWCDMGTCGNRAKKERLQA